MRKTNFNSADLKNYLWATLIDVKRKRITPQVANSVAGTAREIMRITRMELQVLAMNGQKPGKTALTFAGSDAAK